MCGNRRIAKEYVHLLGIELQWMCKEYSASQLIWGSMWAVYECEGTQLACSCIVV